MPKRVDNTAGRPHDSLVSAPENREMFDRIASYYDGTNRILSLGFDRHWRRRAVDRLSPRPGGLYLDVGCGTGDMCVEVLRKAPGCRVVGIDPSEGMLKIGREKVRAAGISEAVSLLRGDVLNLQFPDNSFDGAITAFCIRNVTDRLRGLREMCRVIRPGGSLVILELTDPVGLMKPLFRLYSDVVMPLVTKVMSSVSAYRYLTDSMADFPDADRFVSVIQNAGFADTSYFRMTGGIVTVLEGRKPV
ncbi:MAG: bifunctional demethylmenaquinone methyltransferase/2-methoxy-6-polyprenyl-1,4-benzoquinol methylase UbiE [Thermodesulfobacteriota bacterium]